MLPAIALVCIGAACLTRRKRRDMMVTYSAPCASGQGCGPLPWLGEEVSAIMVEAINAGARDAAPIAIEALRRVYPVDEQGRALRWPTTMGDSDSMRVLESRTILRAQRLVSEVRDMEADELWYQSGGY